MKLVFDENLDYQISAVNAVVSLFDGQPLVTPVIQIKSSGALVPVVGNRLDLDQDTLHDNLVKVQESGSLRPQPAIEIIEGPIEVGEGVFEDSSFYNFSVEMETGTGKTYVYIRTILELARRYGMRKFMIVVPSIAIKEGTIKSLDLTREHFKNLYGNIAYDYYEYDSARLRAFTDSSDIQIMVITLASFNKKEFNRLYKPSDQLYGEAGIDYLRAVRPILILDEPQNMESEKSKGSFLELKPLMALRYSATHRVPYNNVYRLTPWQAYDMRLVKRIEVASVVDIGATVGPYIEVRDIQAKGRNVSAKVVVECMDKSSQPVRKQKAIKLGMDLEELTGHHAYDGYVVAEISRHSSYVQFENGVEIGLGEVQGGERRQVFEKQIEHAIREHFAKQRRLKKHGIKVLTLFFIDRVDNYIADDGVIRTLFDEAFDRLKGKEPDWKDLSPDEVRSGYFAQKKVKGTEEFVDSKTGESKQDEEAYNLIMKEKELLLSFPQDSDDEETKSKKRVAFIFSHSALREGWDNPNVFQICTLNQTTSQMKKRQEIGRGIRLCVNQDGTRVMDDGVNVLTVVANESYADYVRTLQTEFDEDVYDVYRSEIEEKYGKDISELTESERDEVLRDYGAGIVPPPPKQANGAKSKLQKAVVLGSDFGELWDRIKHKTRYRVNIDTERLISNVVTKLGGLKIPEPKIEITKTAVVMDGAKVTGEVERVRPYAIDLVEGRLLPNIVSIVEENLDSSSPPLKITRTTILEIFKRSSAKSEALQNPYGWASVVTRLIRRELADQIAYGIEYVKNGDSFDLSFITKAKQVELSQGHNVEIDTSLKKSAYSIVGCDSKVEEQFVVDLQKRDDVVVYIKLPQWFVVPTPVGNYNPDWAILMKDEDSGEISKLYLVSETKGPRWDEKGLRMEEEVKIHCAAAHFGSKQFKRSGALKDVDYKVVTKAEELP